MIPGYVPNTGQYDDVIVEQEKYNPIGRREFLENVEKRYITC